MKIGIVCYPTFGGSGVLATELGKALALRDHQVHFITYSQPVRLDIFNPNIFYHEVPVPSYPLFEYPPYELALSSSMVEVIMRHQLDLLHVHYAIPHASAGYMAKKILQSKTGRDIPMITTLHGTDITLVGKDKTYEPAVTFSINESDGITAVSENLREETYKNFNISKQIEVIYNFVDVERFHNHHNNNCKCLFAPNDEKIIMHASNFRKVKRVRDVIKIFSNISKQINAKLLMVGDGPERIHCEELARSLGVDRNVRFMGKQEKVEEIFPCADLFILPSEYESFGLAALEAMASHTPVLSTNVGGIPEVNIDGNTGYLYNTGDINTASQKAIELLSDEQKLRTMKENAYRHALEFDIDKIIPHYENFYRRFLK